MLVKNNTCTSRTIKPYILSLNLGASLEANPTA